MDLNQNKLLTPMRPEKKSPKEVETYNRKTKDENKLKFN